MKEFLNKLLFPSVLIAFFVLLLLPKTAFANNPIESWTSTISLPYPLASLTAFSSNNRVSIIGGSAVTGQSKYGPLSSTSSANGNLSDWVNDVPQMPTALIFHAIAKKQNFVYILGGREENPGSSLSFVNSVYLGILNAQGIVTAWASQSSLPHGSGVGASVIVGDRIYYAGGFTSGSMYDDVYSAPINADGTLGSWSLAGQLPVQMFGFGMVEYQNHIILVGGYTPSGFSNKVYAAGVNSDGTLSAFTETSTLPEPVYRGQIIRVGSTVLSVGGNIPSGNKVFYAELHADGSVSNWQTSSHLLPQAVGAGSIAYANGYLYVIGGFNGNYLDTVYFTKVHVGDTPDLPVPLLKQNDPLWGSQEYDTAHLWSPLSPSIAAWGCALTSAAMVFQFHGITKLPDGTNLDPGTLNTWLKTQPDGYIRHGFVNWLALSRLSRLAKTINGVSFDALEYRRVNGSDAAQLTTDLQNNRPDILEEPGHFVVGKGVSGATFTINDPFYNRSDLNPYSNTFLSLGRYLPSNTDLSYILLVADQNTHISLSDSSGSPLGESFIQQPLTNDMTISSSNSAPLAFLYFPSPSSGNYTATISAQNSQFYTLNSYAYDRDGNYTLQSFSGVTGPEKSDTFTLSFDKAHATSSATLQNRTLASLASDIQLLYTLGQIRTYGFYRNILEKATIAASSRDTAVTRQILKILLRDLESQKTRVTDVAFTILTSDITFLLSHL